MRPAAINKHRGATHERQLGSHRPFHRRLEDQGRRSHRGLLPRRRDLHQRPDRPAHRGTEAIRTMISGFLGMAQAVEFVVHHSAENAAAGIVMNERTDRFQIGERWLELPVMGVFELRDGRIQSRATR
ncbi:MAG: hypothetical protein IPF57_14320 [Gammaproteobacteria bacterium]|nr:hypothetical protein [Gammaproteobacteria bacterium]